MVFRRPHSNEAGNLIAVTAPDGGSTLIDYDDELNLPLAVTDNAGRLTEYGYDPFSGNLVKARNGHSSIELAYDALDRLVGETTVHQGQSSTVRYHYDPLGNRLRTELPDGGVLEQLYYGSGHLHRISYNGETVSDLERDALHREIRRTQGHIDSVYDYDPMGRLQRQRSSARGADKRNAPAGAVSRSRDDPTIEARGRRYTSNKGSAGEGMVT